MSARSFTDDDIAARFRMVNSLGLCPDCETPLGDSKGFQPSEECSDCGARYLADRVDGYLRLIQSFPEEGEISRDFSVRMLL